MFLASSYTCSLVLRPCDWHVLLSYCLFIVFFVLSIAVFASSSLFPSFLIGLLDLVSLFSLLGFLSMGVFHSSHRMESVLLLHVLCHYTGILLLLAILFNRLVCSWCSVLETLRFLDWSFLFGHLFVDSRPLTLLFWFLMLCTILPWILMWIGVLYRWWSSLVCHVFSICCPDISLLLHLKRLKSL